MIHSPTSFAVDGAGYFGCLGRVIAERMRRGLGAAYSKLTKRPWE